MRAIIQRRIELMIDYLKMKLEQRDWHGVADAAMDIRELEAELRVLSERKTDTSDALDAAGYAFGYCSTEARCGAV